MKDAKPQLETLLEHVQKPGRYVGGEWNAIKKDPNQAKIKIALAFPDLYEVGMSHLGQKILYFLLNQKPDILAERVFSPWPDFENQLRQHQYPLYSLENRIPLDQFDLIGFSLLYELNYSNVLTMLDLGKIPFLASQRGLKFPLVIAGGPAAFNPEPLADLFDLFLMGDGEEAFVEIAERYMELRQRSLEKIEILQQLSQLKGVYVPTLYEAYTSTHSQLLAVRPKADAPSRIQKRLLLPFQDAQFPRDIIVPNIEIVFDRTTIEVARGCPQNCRFCQARHIYFPSRNRDPDNVIETTMASACVTGYEDVALAALSVSDYPYLTDTIPILMDSLDESRVSLSLSSLRPKGLTPDVAENILRVRKTGFTIVPEAGTDRLRRVINKHLENDDIWSAVENAFRNGWRRIKLYFMLGLPHEQQADIDGIVSLIQEIIRLGYKWLKKPPQINLSVASFIPKPHTPFQWEAMTDESTLRTKHRYLKSQLKKYRFVRFKEHPMKNSILEAVFSRGDRRLTSVLINAWENGARFDSWGDQFKFSVWEKAFADEGVDYTQYLEEIHEKAILPWDHIDTGIKKAHLQEERRLSQAEEYSLPCTQEKCAECGGCSLGWIKESRADDLKSQPKSSHSISDRRAAQVLRYRVIYAKQGIARFYSHIDLLNVFQRSFRRAGMPVEYSAGFHPKMRMTFAPALPLGMQGKREIFEFKSHFVLQEEDFMKRVNDHLPAGFQVLGLTCLDKNHPGLNAEIEYLVYSADLEMPEEWELPEQSHHPSIHRIWVDKNQQKIFLSLNHNQPDSLRAQDVFQDLIDLNNPNFHISREEIVLKTTKNRNAT